MANLLDKYKNILDPIKSGLSTIYDEAVNKTVGNSVRGAVQAINYPVRMYQAKKEVGRLADESLKRQEEAAQLQKMGRYGDAQDLINKGTSLNIQSKGLSRSIPTYYKKLAGDSASGGFKSLFSAAGVAAGLPALAGTAAVSGGIGGGLNYLTGDSVLEGAARGIGQAPQLAGLNKLTSPFFDKALASVGGGSKAATLLKRAPLAGGLNILEDEIFTRATELRNPTGQERLFSFASGALTSPFIKVDEAPISKPAKQYLRDARGRFTKFIDNAKKSLTYTELAEQAEKSKLKLEQVGPRKLRVVDDNASAAFGALFGIELEYETDEQGNITGVKYGGFDPKSAALGVGIAAGIKQLPDKDRIASTFSRSDLSGKLLDLSNKQLKDLFGDSFVEPFGSVKGSSKKLPQFSDEELKQAADAARINTELDFDGFKKTFAKWIGRRDTADISATQIGEKYKNIAGDKFIEFAREVEKTGKSADPKISGAAKVFRKDMDQLFKDAKGEGLDLNYLENYITHMWEQPVEEVQQMYQALKTKGFFQNDRVIPTYDEGLAMGLKPKHTNVGELAADYAKRLEKVKANFEFFKQLKKDGFLVDTAVGGAMRDFKPITAEGFPRSKTIGYDGKVVEGVYYAPAEVADQINRVFGIEQQNTLGKIAEKTAKLSKGLQEVKLSGGIPGTPVNAFSAANALKEVISGRIKSPVVSAIRSLSEKASNNFFRENADQIKKMQLNNIRINTSYNTDSLRSFKDQIKEKPLAKAWDKLMSDPTFKRFMPMLQVNLFNDVEKQALKAGKSADEAVEIASKAVKNFYGSIDTAKMASRSRQGKDIMNTVFFAPSFRESMINFWVNSVKAMKDPLALENRANVKFLAGAAITFGVMNEINKKQNGHNMWENPTYKKDKLLIPAGDITIGIPFLPSIATVPRAVYSAGAEFSQGNISEGVTELMRRSMSAGLAPFFDVAANQDYFGGQIYNPDDEAGQKFKDVGQYLLKENVLAHPWIKEGFDSKAKEDPTLVRISRAAEMPFRFYKTESIKNAPFWDEYNRTKALNDKYQKMRYQDPDKAEQFLRDNAQDLQNYLGMKTRVKAYYEDNKNSDFLNAGAVVGNEVAIVGDDIIELNRTIEPPQFTGEKSLDKRKISAYKSQITKRINEVVKLQEAGIIDAKTAEATIRPMEAAYKAVGSSSKKLKIPKIPPIKIPKAKSIGTSSLVKKARAKRMKKYSLGSVPKLTRTS